MIFELDKYDDEKVDVPFFAAELRRSSLLVSPKPITPIFSAASPEFIQGAKSTSSPSANLNMFRDSPFGKFQKTPLEIDESLNDEVNMKSPVPMCEFLQDVQMTAPQPQQVHPPMQAQETQGFSPKYIAVSSEGVSTGQDESFPKRFRID